MSPITPILYAGSHIYSAGRCARFAKLTVSPSRAYKTLTHAAARSNCPEAPCGRATWPGLAPPALGATFGAEGIGGLPPPVAGAAGLAGADGLGGIPGLAGTAGFGFGAGAGPLLPITLFGREPPGVEVGEAEF